MQRPTLKISAGTDNIVKFGLYHLYAFEKDGAEMGLFASDALHEKLKNFTKGDSVNIRKDEYAPGKHGWNVVPEEGTPMRNSSAPSSVDGSYKSAPSPTTEETRNYQAKQNDDRTKDIHKQVCLKLAVQSLGTTENLDYQEVKVRMEGLVGVLEDVEVKEELPF